MLMLLHLYKVRVIKASEAAAEEQGAVLNKNGDEMEEWLESFGGLGQDGDWKPSPSKWTPRPYDRNFTDYKDPYSVFQGSMDWMINMQVTETSRRQSDMVDSSRDNTPAASPAAGDANPPSKARPHRTKTTKINLPASGESKAYDKIYAPLSKERKEIRVVHLMPEVDSEFDISCTFSVVSLGDKPEYRALSYTWGDAQDTLPIILNRHRFQATRNLKAALRRLRELDTGTPIWIDAICINQQDLEERTHQVQLMRDIYQSTAEVVVYLGEPLTLDNKTLAQQKGLRAAWSRSKLGRRGSSRPRLHYQCCASFR